MTKVLVISASLGLQKRLKAAVKGLDIKVLESSTNASHSLQVFETEKVPFVVVDLFLEDVSCFELIKIMKKAKHSHRVILVSPLHNRAFLENALRIGIDDWLTVPFTDSSFIDIVAHRLRTA